jgi:NAD(P)H-flavin reductase
MFLLLFVSAYTARSISGYGNNLENHSWGATGSPFVNEGNPDASFGYRAFPRAISNELFSKYRNKKNAKNLSFLSNYLGQFIAHDLSMTLSNRSESIPFHVPICDESLDFSCQNISIPFARASYRLDGGTRRVLNYQTAFLDASHIYGTDLNRNQAIRTMRGGLLRVSERNLLPLFNSSSGIQMEFHGRNRSRLFLMGDSRGNETPVLQAFYVLFLREHNRKAQELQIRYPTASDEELFQEARRWVIAIWQKIVYDEYLPLVLGEPFPVFEGYNPNCDASINTMFSIAAFRYGHSQIDTILFRAGPDGKEFVGGSLVLRDVFYDISAVWEEGIEPILLGILFQEENDVDGAFVNEVRNHLAQSPFDLAAINIMRGRDVGIPNYNRARELNRLVPISSFNAFNDSIASQVLPTLYESVHDIDLFVGGLLEPKHGNALFGPLFHSIIKQQFLRIRNCDRYWYQNPSAFTNEQMTAIQSMSFSKLVELNTNITNYPSNPFYLQYRESDVKNIQKEQSIELVAGELTMSWKILPDGLNVVLNKKGDGWFAIGFGSLTMIGSTVFTIGRLNNQVVVTRMLAEGNVIPKTLGSHDATELSVAGFATSVQFKVPITMVTGKKTKMIYAYSNNYVFQYHGTMRGSLTVDFSSNAPSLLPKATDAMRFYHGITMLVTYVILFPVGIFIAGFWHDLQNWLNYHHVLMTIAVMQTISAALGMIFSLYPSQNPYRLHRLFGFANITFSLANYTLGSIMRLFPTIFNDQRRRMVHRWLGYATYCVGFINCYLGIVDFDPINKSLRYIFASLILLILVCFTGAKVYSKRYLDHSLAKQRDSRLPTFSWDEYLEHVYRGEQWVVISDSIYDISSFIDVHPGGRTLLECVIGTDATDQFGVRQQKSNRYNWGNVMIPFNNRVLEIQNIMHQHSRYAYFKLNTLIIGYIEDKEVMDRSSAVSRIPIEEKSNDAISPNKFQPLVLVKRELVAVSATRESTYLFTFAFSGKNSVVEFSPGDWISLSYTQYFGTKLIQKAYAPIKVRNVGQIDLLIKIFPNSKMGTRLLKMDLGATVQARGPIRNISIFRSFYQRYWEDVFLICNGNGICGNLMIIDYLSSKRMFYGTIVLFCHFTTINDIIQKEKLEELTKSTSIKIKVFISVQVASKDWTGMCGPITAKSIATVGNAAELPIFTQQTQNIIDSLELIKKRSTWFSCSGSPSFCSRTKDALSELKIPLDNVCMF